MKDSPTTVAFDRRRFLLGGGGASLLLPVLPSLLDRNEAQAAIVARKRFFFIGSGHGGVAAANMFPARTKADMTPVEILPGVTSHWTPLAGQSVGGDTVISPVLRAPSSLLTSRIIGKMNVLRGIDLPAYYGHHQGVFLGNNRRTDQGPQQFPEIPSIDQVMAYSPSFYGNDEPFRARDMTISSFARLSWTYQNPAARTGVQENPPIDRSTALFDRLFPAGSQTPDPVPMARRPLIIDRVIENYRSLRNGNRRLSGQDRERLDGHVARLAELQRTLAAQSSEVLACGSQTRPAEAYPLQSSPATMGRYFDTMLSIVAAGLACGASRIGSAAVNGQFVDFAGSWHQDVAHQFSDPAKQALLVSEVQREFQHIFLNLVSKLDAITDANGSTVLDNTLVVFGQEAGFETHNPNGVPIVTAGAAAGFFKTGLFCDYRNQIVTCQNTDASHRLMPENYTGLFYPQLLATALLSMGIPRSEWEVNQPADNKGYGLYPRLEDFYTNWANHQSTVPVGVKNYLSNPLPLIT